jgi:hypothetical protein
VAIGASAFIGFIGRRSGRAEGVTMTQKMKTRSAGSKGPNAGLVDLFRPYALAPTPLHAAIQVAAREAGWAPPWAMAARKSKNQIAGRIAAWPAQDVLIYAATSLKWLLIGLSLHIECSHTPITQSRP